MHGETDIGSGGNIVNIWQVPLSPVGPPSLTEIPSHQHDSSLASFYVIDLRNAVPMLDELESSSSLLPVAFLFRVSDHVTRNISYIWQVRVEECFHFQCINVLWSLIIS